MITEKHKAFALSLIELARKYNLGSLNIRTEDSAYTDHFTTIHSYDSIEITWTEARWKEKADICIKGIEHITIEEGL